MNAAMTHTRRSLGLVLLVFSALVFAAYQYSDYLQALCTRESGCNPSIQNNYGFMGSYQMGESALIDAGYYRRDATPTSNDWQGSWTGKNGINSTADFLASPAKQTQAINDYNAVQWSLITHKGLLPFVGQTINGIVLTESGLLAGAHLVGAGGLSKFLHSGGQIVPKDANQVAVTQYISKFSGYDIAPVSGHVTTGGGTGAGSATTGNSRIDAGGSYDPYRLANSTPIDPIAAFQSGSGVSLGEVNQTIQAMIALILLLWAAYVSWGQFRLWSEGAIPLMVMQSNIVKAAVLMTFLLFIVLT